MSFNKNNFTFFALCEVANIAIFLLMLIFNQLQ